MLILSISLASNFKKEIEPTTSETPMITEEKSEEMRGLWVSYLTLNMNENERDFDSFKTKFDLIMSNAIKLKCNTLIIQVRPFCDALYKSDIFPSSHILSGEQGKDPSYDALEYMCQSAHKNNMKIHAWINPLRVKSTSSPPQIAENNPCYKEDDLTINTDSGIYLNPARKTVRKLICDGVREIIENYNIDGIQFDDYFYPEDIGNSDNNDYSTYKKSLSSSIPPMSREEWRINNINMLIAEVYKTIKDSKKEIVFGISPQGNINNNYSISADVKEWCATYGYIDYICPQMYYSLDNPSLEFEDCLKQWQKINYHSNVKKYIGLGVYKAGTDADEGTWLEKNDILAKELKLLREYGYDGYMLYDYKALNSEDAYDEIKNLYHVIDDNT